MDSGSDRQINLQMDTESMAGVYSNFANIGFSDYEFTLTFGRVDFDTEEGDIPGVVVSRVNVSAPFMARLVEAVNDSWSKYQAREQIKSLPETRRPEDTDT